MSCNNETFIRMIIKQGNGVPTIPVSEDHQDGSWLVTDLYIGEWYQDLDTDFIYMRTISGITQVLDSSGAPTTIYTGDGSLPAAADRKFDLSAGQLFIHNGKVYFGTDNPDIMPTLAPGGLPHPFQFKGDDFFGILVVNALNAGYTFTTETGGTGFLCISDPSISGGLRGFVTEFVNATDIGLDIKASYNKIFDSNITPDPSLENSSIFTVWTTRKGTIPFPRMTDAEMNAIAFPAIGLMVYVTDALEGIYVNKSGGWTFVA